MAQKMCLNTPACGGVTKLQSGVTQLRVGNVFRQSSTAEKSWRKIENEPTSTAPIKPTVVADSHDISDLNALL